MGMQYIKAKEDMFEDLKKLSRQILLLKNSSYRRYLIQTNPFGHRLSLVVGQRGVGKTTTIVQHLLDCASGDSYSESILYIPVDHFLRGTTSIYEIAENFYNFGGKVLALDEIHKYTNWSQELKSIYDTFPKLKLIVSGSSALQIHKGSHDLARRAIKFQLFGLSFREYLELNYNILFKAHSFSDILHNHSKIGAEIINSLEQKNKKILPLFHAYLKCGYYPYFLEFQNEDYYLMTLEQNLHTTIETDLAAIYPHLTGGSLSKIKKLLIFISKAVPFTPNWNKLKDLMGIGDVRTLKTYFQYLEDAGLIRSISKESEKLRHIDSPNKVYLDNPNQMHALALGVQNQGTVREVFFLNMLSIQHKVVLPSNGDFLIDGEYLFEIGGRNKSFEQIKESKNSFLACDDMETGFGSKIPLWLFGFLY
jgi:uncharacterized protein